MSPIIKLVKKNSVSNKLEINEDALNIIREIKGQVAIIMIAGPYRSGKSYLISELAKLFLNEYDESLFSVGHTDEPCTEGIWISKEIPIRIKKNQNIHLIFMDTEGLESLNNEMWDTKLFLISLLISTSFIYNTRGALSQDVLNKLSIITDITNKIKLKPGQELSIEEFKRECPDFIWIIRDFYLYQTRSADESLETFLKNEETDNIENERRQIDAENRNQIRENIKKFFNERKCFYFGIPAQNLTNLDRLDNSQIASEFTNKLKELKEFLINKLRPKTVDNKFLNGYLFAEYFKAIVENVNESKTFFMHDAILKLEADYKLNIKKQEYDYKMNEYLCVKRSWEEFKNFENHLCETLRNEINIEINRIHLQECLISLINHRDKVRAGYEKKNSALIKEFNLNQLQTLYCQTTKSEYNDVSEFDLELSNVKLRFKQVSFELSDDELDLFWNTFLLEIVKVQDVKNAIEVKIKEKKITELDEKNRRLNEELRKKEEEERKREEEQRKINENSVYVGNLRIGGWVGKQLKRL